MIVIGNFCKWEIYTRRFYWGTVYKSVI